MNVEALYGHLGLQSYQDHLLDHGKNKIDILSYSLSHGIFSLQFNTFGSLKIEIPTILGERKRFTTTLRNQEINYKHLLLFF